MSPSDGKGRYASPTRDQYKRGTEAWKPSDSKKIELQHARQALDIADDLAVVEGLGPFVCEASKAMSVSVTPR